MSARMASPASTSVSTTIRRATTDYINLAYPPKFDGQSLCVWLGTKPSDVGNLMTMRNPDAIGPYSDYVRIDLSIAATRLLDSLYGDDMDSTTVQAMREFNGNDWEPPLRHPGQDEHDRYVACCHIKDDTGLRITFVDTNKWQTVNEHYCRRDAFIEGIHHDLSWNWLKYKELQGKHCDQALWDLYEDQASINQGVVIQLAKCKTIQEAWQVHQRVG